MVRSRPWVIAKAHLAAKQPAQKLSLVMQAVMTSDFTKGKMPDLKYSFKNSHNYQS